MNKDIEKVDELAKKLRKRMVISLKEANWVEAGQGLEFAVLLRRASGGYLKRKILTEILVGIWKVDEKPKFQKVENNTLLVIFKSEMDRDKVLKGGPWSFEGEALILQKWEEGMTAEDFNNTKIDIFVQLFGLPFELRKDDSVREVVEQIGVIKEHKSNGSLRKSAYGKDFMRYRIEIDVNTPILPGFFMERRGRKPTWVNLKCERLPNVCYKCGLLSHDTKSCSQVLEGYQSEFGGWLKAEDRAEYIQVWNEDKIPGDREEDQSTHGPMCIDSTTQGIEHDKGLTCTPYIGKSALDEGKKEAKEQEQGHVEMEESQEEGEFEFGAIEQEVSCNGPGLKRLKDEAERMGRTVGSKNDVVFKRNTYNRKRSVEASYEEVGRSEKKKKVGGGNTGVLSDVKSKKEQAGQVDGVSGDRFDEVEAESAGHLRREQ